MSESTKRPDKSPASGRTEPALDFTTVVLSLRESTHLLLRELDGASPGDRDETLASAHIQIETLVVLLEKTKGNLSDDEDKLLRSVLYELRLAFVEATRA